MKRIYILISTALLTAACGISQRSVYNNGGTGNAHLYGAYGVSKFNEVRVSLMQAYRDWRGTPYELGGRSASGVDCSSFVSIVYDEYFGVDLPMNTRRLLNRGEGVRRVSLRSGDLVFFRTGRRLLHVGILVDEGEFLHASSSEGVTLSNLYDRYWANRYLGARRVMNQY